ncbi:MAG: hypothetical protein F6K19_10820 [Cyanothece sp. SIO1E1]|nr:hypothetical protein [Cyanothece sp. SIO1E1]
MKKLTFLFIALTLGVIMNGQSLPKEVLGVYKYHLEGQEGLSIISPTHFIWIMLDKNRSYSSMDQLSSAEKAKAYDAMNLAGGTHSYLGNQRVKFTFSIHSSPQAIGSSFEWTYAFDDDLVSFWIMQEDGSKGPLMQSRKLADWNAAGLCSDLNGAWAYEEFKGLYLQCGNYAAWTIHFQELSQVSTAEEKAKAFDVIDGKVAIGDCQANGKTFWNIVHASKISEENITLGTTHVGLGKGRSKWTMLAPNGSPSEPTWHINRLK